MNLISKLKLLLPGIAVEKSKTLSVLQVVVAVLFLTGAGLMCYVFVRNEWTSTASRVIATGESMSGVLAISAQEPIKNGTGSLVQGLASRLSEDKQVSFVEVTDVEGKLIAKAGKVATAAELDGIEPSDSWETEETLYSVYESPRSGDTYYVVEEGIFWGEERLGRVRIALQRPPFSAFVTEGMIHGEVALFGLAVLLVVGNYFIHLLIRPIVRLKKTVMAAQQDEWEKADWQIGGLAPDVPRGGDAGEIATGLGSVISKLGKERQTLVESNRELQVSNRVILFEKRRTESIIEGLSEGVVVTDWYGRICLMNREAEALLELDRTDVLGKTPAEAFRDRPEVARLMADDQSGANLRRSGELDFSNGEGKKIVRAQLSIIPGPSEENAGTIMMLRDFTQSKMEEQARRDFISNVAHELRAPLSAIKSYVEMLIDNEADTPELRAEFFNTINEEADRLARLIDNMLNISKIEVGGLVLNKSSVKTRKLLEDALASVYGTAKGKQIEITSELPEDMPDAELDKELIRVVVMNLLGNAIKYTEPGGSVIMAGEVDADELQVHVVDTGWGIPSDEQEKVFDKFYRGRRTGSEKVIGNGLGLALAREIACLHGGDLRVESEEGKGSKFTLLLPLK